MKIKIITWNVRGVNDPDKRRVIKSFLRSNKVDLVCLQETKVHQMNNVMVRSLGVGRFLNWRALNAEGSAGGILILWDKRRISLVDSVEGSFSVSYLFRMEDDGFQWVFSGVYGPTEKRLSEPFWEELGAIRGLWENPWCVGGDFNEILSPNEISRGSRMSNTMRWFSDVLNDLGLRDLPLQGGHYTWQGGINGSSMSRLDRFLISPEWESQCNRVIQRRLPRPVSDHFPIMLDSEGVKTGPSPFRFELMWLKYAGFKEILKEWWQSLQFYGTSSFILSAKLKALKGLLKTWNREVFGEVETQKKDALRRISLWDELEKERGLDLEEAEERVKARDDFKNWALMEETSWRQKSRETWLKEGDRNTRFFHRMANAHMRRNCLNSISINGRKFESENDIKEGLVNAFQNLLSAPGGWRPPFPDLAPNEIGIEEAARLEDKFSEEEIWAAISGLNSEKAPGPDGFPLAFWSFSWDFVKNEVLGFFKEFHEQGRFVKHLNATFLVLIPKKQTVEDLKDLRPISLVGGLYKILTKVLANRIKRVLDKVISKSQNAFVEGRQILDAVLIANEIVDSTLRRKECGLICKLDIEKAYDSISWEFLFQVMGKMGFGDRWMSWIKWCISTASFSVLVNGSPTGFFPSSRGLRQGDPLSPYLFVIGMETLSRLLNRANVGNYFSGTKFVDGRGEEMVISHLLYADDTLLFCKADKDELKFISWTLMWFEAVSGLKINLNKSEIIPIGTVANMEELALELGCKVGTLPTTYLGLPLGAKHKALSVWDSVEERFRKRLASWKLQYISKGGRVTLIRSSLSSLPIYHLSLFRAPLKVCARLERIQRQFLWGGSDLVKKVSLVSWATVCTEKRKGGMGIKSLSKMNKALLSKWNWRFANDRNSLWRIVIGSKFGESANGWHTRDLRGGFGTSLWKEIRKEWPSFSQNSVFTLGDGRRINFWKDIWCGEEALCFTYPSLFNLASNKEAKIADIWDRDRGAGSWSPNFLRPLNDWEIKGVATLLHTLHEVSYCSSGEDKLLLKGDKGKGFSVSSMYKCFDSFLAFDFPYRLIWNPVVPPKIGVFAWEATWGKVLTLDQLRRRGMIFVNRCFMCGEDEENIDHLLIHCKSAKMLWNLFLSIVGTCWVFPQTVIHTLLAWQGAAVGKKRKRIWLAAPLCIFWTLWRARNKLGFENEGTTDQKIKTIFVTNLWAWANTFREDKTNSVVEFLTWLGSR